MCIFEIRAHAIHLMDLKSGVLVTKQRGGGEKPTQMREETLVAGIHFLSQDCKLYRLFNKRKTVLKLICLLCYYVLNPAFVEHGLDCCLCWSTFYFAGEFKCTRKRKMA